MSCINPRELHDIVACDCGDCENVRRAEATHDYEPPSTDCEDTMTEKSAKPMDVELLKRGIRAAEVGLNAIESAVRRDVEGMREQLAELQRSIDRGEPSERIRRFGLAREISYAADSQSLADQLANEILYGEYYANMLQLSVWPLLCIASGIEGDTIKDMIRLWCHGAALELDEETERAMFAAAGLTYKRAKVDAERIVPTVYTDDADDKDEVRHAS